MEIYQRVNEAYDRIKGSILNTALVQSYYLSKIINGKVYLKCENEQHTGSFKARGSLNKVLSLSPEQMSKGMITASTGNHALGFARACSIVEASGTIFLPHNASKAKVDKLSNFPVKLQFHGEESLSTEIEAKRVAIEAGSIWVSPYNDLEIISGQGTIGLEITEQLDSFDYLFATIGGGGLISGIGSYLKTAKPDVKIIGCQPANSPEMTLSIEAGKIVDIPEYIYTLSDGSAGGIEPGAITFSICKEIVDDTILVSEEEIKSAIRLIAREEKKIIEGAAGVAVASLIKNKEEYQGATVVIVLCGGNIDYNKFVDVITE